jgi:1-acyl-sn-glycerol-3-phosphate acyltransferase
MAKDARGRADEGREIVIFPEGTRRAPHSLPDYKPGVLLLYQNLGAPVSPVALNSGVCWPRHSRLRYPGTIIVEFLDPIPAGLDRRAFMERLAGVIEPATARLVEEAEAELAGMGFSPE